MKTEYRYCQHIPENGDHCASAALTGRDYCRYHLRYRGRLMRMAQARARNQRLHFILPPLENMHAVQSALSQVVEEVAADMIDLKHARVILTALRQAAQNLKVEWRDSAYRNEAGGTYDQFELEFGLPENLDLNTPPEVAFPPPENVESVILSGGGASSAPPQSKDPYSANNPHGVVWPADAAGLRDLVTNLVTPEYVELEEIHQTQGSEAASARSTQMMRNERRREFRSERKRYADIAMNINLRRAADRLADRKLAELAQASGLPVPVPKKFDFAEEWAALTAPKATTKQAADCPTPPSVAGVSQAPCPIPASVAGAGVSPDAAKKSPASAARDVDEYLAGKEATTA